MIKIKKSFEIILKKYRFAGNKNMIFTYEDMIYTCTKIITLG